MGLRSASLEQVPGWHSPRGSYVRWAWRRSPAGKSVGPVSLWVFTCLAWLLLPVVHVAAFGPGNFPTNLEDPWAVEGGRRQGRGGSSPGSEGDELLTWKVHVDLAGSGPQISFL